MLYGAEESKRGRHHRFRSPSRPTGRGRPKPGMRLGHEYFAIEDEQMLQRSRKRLVKRARMGFRGYPVATVALYGPDDTTATKLAVGIVPAENSEVSDLRRWFSEGSDIRN